jgi:hypothetical protein
MPSQLTLLHPLLLHQLLRQPLLLLQLKRLRSNSWKSFLAVKEKPRSAGFFFAWRSRASIMSPSKSLCYLISSDSSLMILSALAEVSGMPSAP